MSTTSSQAPADEPRRPEVSQAQQTAEAKAAFAASLKSVGANIDTELQARAKNIHSMDKSLSKQQKDLQKETKAMAKQNDELQKFLDKSSKQLSSFDDLEHLHQGLDTDLADIEAMLNSLEKGGEEEEEERSHRDAH